MEQEKFSIKKYYENYLYSPKAGFFKGFWSNIIKQQNKYLFFIYHLSVDYNIV
jgi:hypothetical protein